MKKTLILISTVCLLSLMNFTAHAVAVDVSSSATWNGYMNVFENTAGAQGAYLFGSGWGTSDLATSWTGESLSFSPNTNGYADNAGSADTNAVSYWTDSSDGGVTAGNDGNKFMEASLFREAGTGQAGENLAWNGQTLSFSGTISAADLDTRYSAVAFIKTLDVDNGFATVPVSYTHLTLPTKRIV